VFMLVDKLKKVNKINPNKVKLFPYELYVVLIS